MHSRMYHTNNALFWRVCLGLARRNIFVTASGQRAREWKLHFVNVTGAAFGSENQLFADHDNDACGRKQIGNVRHPSVAVRGKTALNEKANV